MNVLDVDALRRVKDEISEVNDKLDQLKKQKSELELKLIGEMNSEGLSLARTDYGTISVTKTEVASVKDWNLFEDYIYKNHALHLLQRRAANAAYRDEIAVKGEIPGVETFTQVSLSLTNKVTS
jgi:hypothetical protein